MIHINASRLICWWKGHDWTWTAGDADAGLFLAGMCKRCGEIGDGEEPEPITPAEDFIFGVGGRYSDEELLPALRVVILSGTVDTVVKNRTIGGDRAGLSFSQIFEYFKAGVSRRHRNEVERLAESYWIDANKPQGRDEEFWLEAEWAIVQKYLKEGWKTPL